LTCGGLDSDPTAARESTVILDEGEDRYHENVPGGYLLIALRDYSLDYQVAGLASAFSIVVNA
jgi:hypothetical protein